MLYDSFFDSVFDSIFNDDFDDIFGSSFKAPKVIKSMCESTYPQSNVFVNNDTKEIKITVCLPGISEKDCRLDRDDNLIVLSVEKKHSNTDNWVEIQNGFKSPEKCRLSWKIDPAKYDLDNISVSLSDGMMEIVIQPTDVAKPKKVSGLFGSLPNPKKVVLENKAKKSSEKTDDDE